MAIVGFTDDTVSAIDWCIGISALLGIASMTTVVCPPLSLGLDGLSICFGIASLFVPGDSDTPGGLGTSGGY
ncbi:hypothetical protein [uncultured Bacteroides sp.]|uniref:hypothetical protein n=1 Tax=uncultured Bacteroides sp. TaxID=162156 RepID=UPI002AA775C5|nr:hypothetical protein [uncultured Bacteroides sp.]